MFATVEMMYFGVVMLGLSYGSLFCLVPTLLSEFFGLSNFGASTGFIGLAPAAGSQLFSTLMAGRLADDEQQHHYVNVTTNDGTDFSLHCLGADCFRTSLITTAAACATALLAAVFLSWRGRKEV